MPRYSSTPPTGSFGEAREIQYGTLTTAFHLSPCASFHLLFARLGGETAVSHV